MVLFDASVIAIAFDKNAAVPLDPSTGKPLDRAKERVDALVKTLSDSRTQIVIPTPALSEYLVRGGKNKSQRLQIFQSSKAFTIRDFDTMAAVECATLNDPALHTGKRLETAETYAKLKFDRQIIAIAKAHRVTTIYTGDKTLAHVATQNGIKAVLTWDLSLPPEEAQIKLPFKSADDEEPAKDEKATQPATPPKPAEAQPAKAAEAEQPKREQPANNGSSPPANVGNPASAPAVKT